MDRITNLEKLELCDVECDTLMMAYHPDHGTVGINGNTIYTLWGDVYPKCELNMEKFGNNFRTCVWGNYDIVKKYFEQYYQCDFTIEKTPTLLSLYFSFPDIGVFIDLKSKLTHSTWDEYTPFNIACYNHYITVSFLNNTKVYDILNRKMIQIEPDVRLYCSPEMQLTEKNISIFDGHLYYISNRKLFMIKPRRTMKNKSSLLMP